MSKVTIAICGRVDGAMFQKAASIGTQLQTDYPAACAFEIRPLDPSEWEFYAIKNSLVSVFFNGVCM